jgi:hypothetical protein
LFFLETLDLFSLSLFVFNHYLLKLTVRFWRLDSLLRSSLVGLLFFCLFVRLAVFLSINVNLLLGLPAIFEVL